MKKLIIALLFFTIPVHAATFKGCKKIPTGDWQCIYHVHVAGVVPPLNPAVDMTLGVAKQEAKTQTRAHQITADMAHHIEHPDQAQIDAWQARELDLARKQKSAENAAVLAEKQMNRDDANFINQDMQNVR